MEDFVTIELAKKLEEKGFPQRITDEAYIVDNYGEDECDIGDLLPIPLIPDYMDDVAAPTISQVLKWLRDKKAIHIDIAIWEGGWYCDVWLYEFYEEEKEYLTLIRHQSDDYKSYEDAALAGIEYVLDNLI